MKTSSSSMRATLILLAGGISLSLSGCTPTASDSPPRDDAAAHAATDGRESGGAGGLSEGLGTFSESTTSETQIGVPAFVDVYEELGLDFVQDNGDSPAKLMVQSTAGGVAWIDYDQDGDWDLYFPQGGYPFEDESRLRPTADQFYRSRDNGERFQRVSEFALPSDGEFGHGVVVGDFDNDGFDDVFVSNVGHDILYQNLGDGTFLDVTLEAGIADIDSPLWSASAAWYDLDLDSDLDLYVCKYLDYDPWDPIDCLDENELPGICHPMNIEPLRDLCFFNQGDGTFLEQAHERGLEGPGGKSLGVVIADLTDDGLPDVYVANDTTANHLFVNLGDGDFEERAAALGCATNSVGQFQASMGVGFGDFDENGFSDLYVTHFTNDSNTLYAGYGKSGFEDLTKRLNLHAPTLPYLAFGTVMSDFDCNGRQDIFVANGHIDDWTDQGDLWYMPAQLFTFDGEQWQEITNQGGKYFERFVLGRGVATADYDGDGDADLAVVHQNEPSALLRNDSDRGHWLQLRFRGRESNRRGIGVHVTVEQGSRTLVQQLAGGTSYCVGHQPALFFGLGESNDGCQISIKWPSGRMQRLEDVKVDQILTVDEETAEAS